MHVGQRHEAVLYSGTHEWTSAEMTGRGKYETLLDPALWDYIDSINAWYPPEITDLPIAKQRQIYDRMCRAFASPIRPG